MSLGDLNIRIRSQKVGGEREATLINHGVTDKSHDVFAIVFFEILEKVPNLNDLILSEKPKVFYE